MGACPIKFVLIVNLTPFDDFRHLWFGNLSIPILIDNSEYSIQSVSIYVPTDTLEERVKEKNSLVLLEDVIFVGIKFGEVLIYLSVDSLFVKALHL